MEQFSARIVFDVEPICLDSEYGAYWLGQPAGPPIFRLLTPWSARQTTFRPGINSPLLPPDPFHTRPENNPNKNTPGELNYAPKSRETKELGSAIIRGTNVDTWRRRRRRWSDDNRGIPLDDIFYREHPRVGDERNEGRGVTRVPPSVSFRPASQAIARLVSRSHVDHTGPGMHATFFVSLWKREKCANRFLEFSPYVVPKWRQRREKGGGGGEREREARWILSYESDRTCTIPIPYMQYHRPWLRYTFVYREEEWKGEPWTPDYGSGEPYAFQRRVALLESSRAYRMINVQFISIYFQFKNHKRLKRVL